MTTKLIPIKQRLHTDFHNRFSLLDKCYRPILIKLWIVISVFAIVLLFSLSTWTDKHLAFYVRLAIQVALPLLAMYGAVILVENPALEWVRRLSSVYQTAKPSLCSVQFENDPSATLPLPNNFQSAVFRARLRTGAAEQEAYFFTVQSVNDIGELPLRPSEAVAYTESNSDRIMCFEIGSSRWWRSLRQIERNHSQPASLHTNLPFAASSELSTVAFEHIVQQAMLGLPWKNCCTDLLSASQITETQINREIQKRAHEIVYKPMLVQFLVCIVICGGFIFTRSMFFDLVILVGFSACISGHITYDLLLLALNESRFYMRQNQAVALGTIALVVITALFAILLAPFSVLLAEFAHWNAMLPMGYGLLSALSANLTKRALVRARIEH